MAATVHRTRAHRIPPAPPRPLPEPRFWASALVAGCLAVAGLGVHGVLSGPGDVPASAAGTGSAPVVRTVKAHPGDSLWSIAERHRGDVPIQRYVDALIDLNGGTRIEAGQLVRLP